MNLTESEVEAKVPRQSGELPRVFGRYVLFDMIGRGGMAEIYLARADTELGGSRLVVVKQILPRFSADPAFEKMLVSEAKLAARLQHASVVNVFDLGRASASEDQSSTGASGGADQLFIAMEYVEGFDLNQLLRELSRSRVPLPAEFAVFMVREVLAALGYAHRMSDDQGQLLGLVHRDVSPSNVLISFEGEVKLCDFGIARALHVSDELAEEGADEEQAVERSRVVGKSAYMAPEHARGETIDARADLFAAGVLLWELCAGRRMYQGNEEERMNLARMGQVPEFPHRGLPAEDKLRALLARALAPRPAERFRNAAQMLEALDDYAFETRLMASQLRFGTFLTDNFASRILQMRREREVAATAVPSQIPPAMPVGGPPVELVGQGAADGTVEAAPVNGSVTDGDDDPTILAASPLEMGDGELAAASRVQWREPGAPDVSPSLGASAGVQVQEPGLGVSAALPDMENIPLEIDTLQLEGPAASDDVPAPLPASRTRGVSNTFWYVVALLILLGGSAYLVFNR